MECYAPCLYRGYPLGGGAISSRNGPSYPQRAAWCCNAAQAGGQMLRCGMDSGQIFSELISFCRQLIVLDVLTFYIVAWHAMAWKQSSDHSIKETL